MCLCKMGYSGSIDWLPVSGRFSGYCSRCDAGTWTNEIGMSDCVHVECPSHAVNHPFCECDEGHRGLISWNEVSGVYESTCSVCPAGTFKLSVGLGECIPCETGKWSASGSFDCNTINCPENSLLWPDCACNAGKLPL
jgi:hypothetical protein